MHLYKTSLLFLIYGNCCMLQKKWPILYIYFSFFLSLIYIFNYYIDRKKYATYATKTLQNIGIIAFLLLQNCCRCVALVADVVADVVADTFHLLQKLLHLLHLPFIVSCNNLQQIFFIIFLVSATESVQFCNTICNAYLFMNVVYLYICNNFCNKFLI